MPVVPVVASAFMTRLPALLLLLAVLFSSHSSPVLSRETLPVPRDVETLWSDFDPRTEPLNIQVVREWEKDGIVYRYVTFFTGRFKDVDARMAAFYGFLTRRIFQ